MTKRLNSILIVSAFVFRFIDLFKVKTVFISAPVLLKSLFSNKKLSQRLMVFNRIMYCNIFFLDISNYLVNYSISRYFFTSLIL